MHSKTLFLAAAAFGAVNASPVFRRQASEITSAVGGAATSATGAAGDVGASATSLAGGAPGSATSAAGSATSAAETAVESVTATETTDAETDAETAVETATATETATAAVPTSTDTDTDSDDDTEGGSELYPCPPGYLLTYAQVNQTVPIPVTEATAAAGEWADSPLFPEVSDAEGGTEPGATHTINVLGVSIPEVLVNATSNETSGFAQWVWNNTAPVSVPDQGIEISNYSTVFKAYDPDFTTTGEIGNTTFVQIFTNACSNNQNATVTLLETLANFELSQLAAALGGNDTSPAAETTMAEGGDVATTVTAATEEVTASETDLETATQTAEQTATETSSAVETETDTAVLATATETAATETVESTAATETVQTTAATNTAVTTAETVTATTTSA